jgi:hypothetical protein
MAMKQILHIFAIMLVLLAIHHTCKDISQQMSKRSEPQSRFRTQAYGTPTVSAVIAHKWSLYGRRTLTVRALLYLVYTAAFTAYAVIYSTEDRTISFTVSGWLCIAFLT